MCALCQVGEKSIPLCSGGSSPGLGPNVAPGTDGQSKRGHGRIVRSFEYRNDIVTPQCPEKLLPGNAEFFCQFPYGVGALCGVFSVANPLIRETRQDNVCRHDDFSLSRLRPLKQSLTAARPRGACATNQAKRRCRRQSAATRGQTA